MKKYYLLLILTLVACSHAKPVSQIKETPKPAMQSGYAPVNGLQMYYEIWGEGEPLVLIHGGGSTIESNYSRILPLLAKTHRVIAIEEQGHGHTKSIDRPFTFENTASDVVALLDYLKISKASVMGFSNGGTIALLIAIRHPDKVNKLIIASSAYRRDGMIQGFWKGMMHASIKDMPQSLKDADAKINPDPKHLEQLFKQDAKRMQEFKDLKDKDIKAIQNPTLILNADHDVVTNEHAVKMFHMLPKGQLVIVPGTHGSYLGEVEANNPSSIIPEATVSLLNEFLASVH